MLKNILFSLIVCASCSLVGAPKKLNHEEKVAKRIQKILESKESIMHDIRNNIEMLQGLLKNIIAYTEKEDINTELLEKLNEFFVSIITRFQEGQHKYLESFSTVCESVQVKTIAKKEFEEVKEFHTKHLELFSDEIVFLINLLLPLKDIDTMTQEEITQALTF